MGTLNPGLSLAFSASPFLPFSLSLFSLFLFFSLSFSLSLSLSLSLSFSFPGPCVPKILEPSRPQVWSYGPQILSPKPYKPNKPM